MSGTGIPARPQTSRLYNSPCAPAPVPRGDVQTKAAELLKMTFRQFRYKLQSTA